MSDYQKYFPTTIFQDQIGPCAVNTATAVTAATTAATLAAGVTGKRHRVVSATFHTDAATSSLTTIQSNATQIGVINAPSITSPELVLPFNPAGWFETATGDPLKHTTGAQQVYSTYRYITFTP